MKPIAVTKIAAASVPASYDVAVSANFGSDAVAEVTLISTLDADVYVSMDASTNHFVVPAGVARVINPEDVGAWVGGKLTVKRVSGAPTTGNIYIEGSTKD